MNRVLNIAHRGARSLTPENTMAAARKALEIGADLWETDVQVTLDGELVLMHDDTLVRTTNAVKIFPNRAPWELISFTLADLLKLDYGSWFIEDDPFGQIEAGAVTPVEMLDFPCEKIPTLREALLFTKEYDWLINLELKHMKPPMDVFPIVDKVLALIDECKIEKNRVIISSFFHDWLRQVQRDDPEISVQALVGNLPASPENVRFDTYNVWSAMVEEEQIRVFAERGIKVNIFTVNEKEEMQRFIAAGVSGIFTDFPQILKTMIQ
ncbi:MAG: hypothetical protein JXA42_17160 [Anaerolineales bacterium]|nr:hypothetical protein [Anaerolineales bacterium]